MFLCLLVDILVLVLVVCLCPSSVHVVATFPGTVLIPLQCSVLPFFPQYIDSFLYLVLLFQLDVIELKNKNQLDDTYYFILLLLGSTCFGHYYAHHQELATIMSITTLVVSFCRDGRGSVNVKLCFLLVYVRCEVLCCLVVTGNVFLLILIVVILCVW